jgi:hypothetical protein
VVPAEKTDHILTGWKEIAHHLHVGVRTAQRWELDLGMPVRRPHGRSRSTVVALDQELDLWVQSRPVTKPALPPHTSSAQAEPYINPLQMQRKLQMSGELQMAVAQSLREFTAARTALSASIKRLSAQLTSSNSNN